MPKSQVILQKNNISNNCIKLTYFPAKIHNSTINDQRIHVEEEYMSYGESKDPEQESLLAQYNDSKVAGPSKGVEDLDLYIQLLAYQQAPFKKPEDGGKIPADPEKDLNKSHAIYLLYKDIYQRWLDIRERENTVIIQTLQKQFLKILKKIQDEQNIPEDMSDIEKYINDETANIDRQPTSDYTEIAPAGDGRGVSVSGHSSGAAGGRGVSDETKGEGYDRDHISGFKFIAELPMNFTKECNSKENFGTLKIHWLNAILTILPGEHRQTFKIDHLGRDKADDGMFQFEPVEPVEPVPQHSKESCYRMLSDGWEIAKGIDGNKFKNKAEFIKAVQDISNRYYNPATTSYEYKPNNMMTIQGKIVPLLDGSKVNLSASDENEARNETPINAFYEECSIKYKGDEKNLIFTQMGHPVPYSDVAKDEKYSRKIILGLYAAGIITIITVMAIAISNPAVLGGSLSAVLCAVIATAAIVAAASMIHQGNLKKKKAAEDSTYLKNNSKQIVGGYCLFLFGIAAVITTGLFLSPGISIDPAIILITISSITVLVTLYKFAKLVRNYIVTDEDEFNVNYADNLIKSYFFKLVYAGLLFAATVIITINPGATTAILALIATAFAIMALRQTSKTLFDLKHYLNKTNKKSHMLAKINVWGRLGLNLIYWVLPVVGCILTISQLAVAGSSWQTGIIILITLLLFPMLHKLISWVSTKFQTASVYKDVIKSRLKDHVKAACEKYKVDKKPPPKFAIRMPFTTPGGSILGGIAGSEGTWWKAEEEAINGYNSDKEQADPKILLCPMPINALGHFIANEEEIKAIKDMVWKTATRLQQEILKQGVPRYITSHPSAKEIKESHKPGDNKKIATIFLRGMHNYNEDKALSAKPIEIKKLPPALQAIQYIRKLNNNISKSREGIMSLDMLLSSAYFKIAAEKVGIPIVWGCKSSKDRTLLVKVVAIAMQQFILKKGSCPDPDSKRDMAELKQIIEDHYKHNPLARRIQAMLAVHMGMEGSKVKNLTDQYEIYQSKIPEESRIKDGKEPHTKGKNIAILALVIISITAALVAPGVYLMQQPNSFELALALIIAGSVSALLMSVVGAGFKEKLGLIVSKPTPKKSTTYPRRQVSKTADNPLIEPLLAESMREEDRESKESKSPPLSHKP